MVIGKETCDRELWTQEPFLISTFWFLGFNLQFTDLFSSSSRARAEEKVGPSMKEILSFACEKVREKRSVEEIKRRMDSRSVSFFFHGFDLF